MIRRRDFIKLAAMAGGTAELGSLHGLERPTNTHPALGGHSVSPGLLAAHLKSIADEFVTLPEEEAHFLNLLLKLSRAKSVLELGTAHGYTTIWLALALEITDGHLTTIEILPERVALAKKHLKQAGLARRVQFIQGDAHEIVPSLKGQFDLAYLDADKSGNLNYFHSLFPGKLAQGSLLVAHNAIMLEDSMKDYLAMVQHHEELDTIIVRAVQEDGFALSHRSAHSPLARTMR